MEYSITELRQKVFERVFTIYDIFKGFFGEDKVDLQKVSSEEVVASVCTFLCIQKNEEDKYEVSDDNIDTIRDSLRSIYPFIYVWWPQVTVTNDNGKSVVIQDLYAKINVTIYGNIPMEYLGFKLNRTTYTQKQFSGNYLHSHIREIPMDCFSRFMEPCLGDGPIRNTILTLRTTYDESWWMLFCDELSKYVTVESLKGGPWKRLEEIGNGELHSSYRDYKVERLSLDGVLDSIRYHYDGDHMPTLKEIETIIKDFIRYYLQNGHLVIGYQNGMFCAGMSFYDFIIDISNSFIEYYNTHMDKTFWNRNDVFRSRLLEEVFTAGGKFYYNNNPGRRYNFNNYIGKYVLTFKGQEKRVNIIDSTNNEEKVRTTLLGYDVANYILQSILKIINFRYEDDKTRRKNRAKAKFEGITSSYQTVCYI